MRLCGHVSNAERTRALSPVAADIPRAWSIYWLCPWLLFSAGHYVAIDRANEMVVISIRGSLQVRRKGVEK